MTNEPSTPSMEQLAAFYRDAIRRQLDTAGHQASAYLTWAETGDKLKIASMQAMQELHDMLRAHFDRQASAAIAEARTRAAQAERDLGLFRDSFEKIRAMWNDLYTELQPIIAPSVESGEPSTDQLDPADSLVALRTALRDANRVLFSLGQGPFMPGKGQFPFPIAAPPQSDEPSTGGPFAPEDVIHDDGESKWIKFPWDDAEYTADQARSRARQLNAAADRIDSLNLYATAERWPVGTPVWFRRYGDGPWELSKTINLPWTKNGVTYVTVDAYPPQAGAARRLDGLRTVDDPPADTEPPARPL